MYYKDIERKVRVLYSLAESARKKGFDPASKVEVPVATDLPERVTGLVSALLPQVKDIRVEKRIRELEKQHGFLNPAVAFVIADEIASERFCKFKNKLEAIEAGVRVGFAYLTLGSVASPLEGFTRLELGKNVSGEDYFVAFFSGPIRSAGGTAAGISLMLIDYLRERFGYGKYDPREDEVERTVTEINDYHERVTNLQYFPSEAETRFAASNLPIQISGDPSEDLEVSNYKTVERVGTANIRSGFCLVMGECLMQKSSKLFSIVEKLREKNFPLKDWDFLARLADMQKNRSEQKQEVSPFIKDLVAGRPVLAHPSRQGGLRLRYGRTRSSGYSCVALHPALMFLLKSFIAVGTQLRTEKPGKSAAVSLCDSILGPVVKLEDESVIQVNNVDKARKISSQIKEILYLGDVLVSYGDFYNRNHPLLPAGYCEEWWESELEEKGKKVPPDLDFEEVVKLGKEYLIPLHPEYIFFWKSINLFQFRELLRWLSRARMGEEIVFTLSGESEEAKRALELLAVPHTVIADKVVVKEASNSFLFNLGIESGKISENYFEDIIEKVDSKKYSDVLELVNELCPLEVRDKAGTFIGARMGRPEKAKPRKLTGQPNVLFPVGSEGGRLRSFQEAVNRGGVTADFPIYYCTNCKKETIYYLCEKCERATRKLYFCNVCKRQLNSENCKMHGKADPFVRKRIDIKHFIETAREKLNLIETEMPPLMKGVRGTSSASHTPENLAKGILRANFRLNVNKDGTVRIDLTEMPLTHFKPIEIGTSVDKLKELGYKRDIQGKELKSPEQVLELKVHDLLIPACSESLDERVDEVFVRIANFIDNLFARFYGLRPFYNLRNREDLVGQLVVGLAPHTSVGVVGRIIGFSGVQALYAHPFWHAANRRDCDGDEVSLMLLLDTLLNFSRSYLPSHRGATQDAPLILNARIKGSEVDDMAFDMEIVDKFPLELYMKAENFANPKEVEVQQAVKLIDKDLKGLKFTHSVTNINSGVVCSAYKKLATMEDKVKAQMEVAEKVRGVDESDVARLVIERHFIRDIKGNLRKFSSQQFRCVKCNAKFRRPPLTGICFCGGRIIFTVAEGGIVKYLEPALQLAEKYDVSPYIKQSLEIVKMRIESIFGRDKEKQEALQKWF